MTDAAAEPVAAEPAPHPLALLAERVAARTGGAVLGHALSHGELTLRVDPDRAPEVVEFLKNDEACRFTTLVDLTAVDWPGRPKRFDVVWHFLSMYLNHRIRLKAEVAEDAMVPSITGVHPSADWFEREVFDLFGIVFSGHSDLRRILTDYGFRGHPLRKDFPTTGYTEVRYDEVEKRVVYEPVRLVQEYRIFDFLSPWEGGAYALPGDEKAQGGSPLPAERQGTSTAPVAPPAAPATGTTSPLPVAPPGTAQTATPPLSPAPKAP